MCFRQQPILFATIQLVWARKICDAVVSTLGENETSLAEFYAFYEFDIDKA